MREEGERYWVVSGDFLGYWEEFGWDPRDLVSKEEFEGLAEARAYVEGKGEGEKGEVGGLVVIAVRGRDYWVVD